MKSPRFLQRFVQTAIFMTVASSALALADDKPVFMSDEWATQACTAWNNTPQLVNGLGGKWIGNNSGRGYKIIHMYRNDCEGHKQVELRIDDKDGKAVCGYGGKVEHQTLNYSVDYLMYADTKDWHNMGAGKYGPMHAMMFGDLLFKGPKWEAMGVMGPFAQFLLLAGKVPSNEDICPGK